MNRAAPLRAEPLGELREQLLAGEVTLFLVDDVDDVDGDLARDVDVGREVGRRTPVVTLRAPALLNPGTAPSGYRFVLGRSPDAVTATLEAQSTTLQGTTLLNAVANTCATVLGRAEITRVRHRLDVGANVLGPDSAGFVTRPSWMVPTDGSVTLDGRAIPSSGIWLDTHVTVATEQGCSVEVLEVAEVAEAEILAGIGWMFHSLIEATIQRAVQQIAGEVADIAGARLSAHAVEVDGLRLLLDEADGVSTPAPLRDLDPLVWCCAMAAAASGLRITAPSSGLQGQEGRQAVRAVARASHLFVRSVALRAKWWQRSVLPMVAYRPDGTPVALVPDGTSWWVVQSDGTRHRAGDPDCPELLKVAFAFAAPPQDQRAGAAALIRWATLGQLRPLVSVVFWATVLAAAGLMTPLASRVVFGEIIPQGDRARLWWLLAGLVLVAVASVPLQLASTGARTRVETAVALRLQSGVLGRLMRSPVNIVKRRGAGDIARRLAVLEYIRDPLQQATLVALPAVLSGVLAAALLFVYDVTLAAASIVWGLVVLGVAIWMARRTARAQAELDIATGEVNGFLHQVFGATASLQIAGAESQAFAAWAQRFRAAIGRQLTQRSSSQAVVLGMVGTANTFVLLLAVATRPTASLDTGTFIVFQMMFGMYMAGMVAVASGLGTIFQSWPALSAAAELACEPQEVSASRRDPGVIRGSIAFSEVSFRDDADAPLVLDGLDIDIAAGEMVAIVGRSGCGKSTVLRLLMGFESPEQGSVMVDDHSLDSLDLEALRRQMGVVLQGGQLIPGTVHQNIAGATSLSEREVWELADLVAIGDDLRAMPMGLDTLITLTGGAFSGGQRQRILIARALATKPRVLLLDEATSALDNVTQSVVTNNLGALGLTRVVVAHRLSTVVDADRIIVLDAGRVLEQGTYRELMSLGGHFHQLAVRQEL